MLDVSEALSDAGVAYSCVPAPSNPFLFGGEGASWLCRLEGGPLECFEFHLTCADEPDVSLAVNLLLLDVRAFRDCRGYADFARLLGIDEDDPSGHGPWNEAARLSALAVPVEALLDGVLAPGPAV